MLVLSTLRVKMAQLQKHTPYCAGFKGPRACLLYMGPEPSARLQALVLFPVRYDPNPKGPKYLTIGYLGFLYIRSRNYGFG